MSLSPAYDLALNDMLATYKTGDDASNNQSSAKLVKAAAEIKVSPKVKADKPQGSSSPASNGGTVVVVMSSTPTTKLDASSYIKAVRQAGYRLNDAGKRYFDPLAQRDDMIEAINCYIGYDLSKDFASQELAARTQAAREIRLAKGEVISTGPDRAEARRVKATLSGYVAGIPDTTSKDLANLEARERLAVNTLIEQEKIAMTAATDQEKGKALAFAQVERERLVSIRQDLANHGK